MKGRALPTTRWFDVNDVLHHLQSTRSHTNGYTGRYFAERQDTKDVVSALLVVADSIEWAGDRIARAIAELAADRAEA